MGKSSIEAHAFVAAPIEHVFERITDHEGMREWPGVAYCQLVVEGEPRNGMGAVRRIRAGGLTLEEQVVRFEPPRGYSYTIVKGLPVEHLGEVELTKAPGGVDVRWRVRMSSRVPLLAEAVGAALQVGLRRALGHFARVTATAKHA
jgi:uncharacterized protein YndB with AHSA1/START domain